MKKGFAKTVVALLSAVMMITLIPGSLFAGKTQAEEAPALNPVLEVNGGMYATLQEAVNSAQDQTTIRVQGDFYVGNPVTVRVNGTVILDLNGHSIYMMHPGENTGTDQSGTAEATDKGGILQITGGTLLIRDSAAGGGRIVSSNQANPALVVQRGDSTSALAIESGSFQASDAQNLIGLRDGGGNPIGDGEAQPGTALSVSISGGNFNRQQPGNFMAGGYGMQDRGDGTYDVVVMPKTYTITWMDDFGNLLETDTVNEGEMPVFYGGVPYKAEDEANTYEFAAWSPEVGPAYGDASYMAVFNPIPKTIYYTITWTDDLGNVLAQDAVEAGTVPVYNGDVPYKADDEANTYEFMGWTPAVDAAWSDATYMAVFSAVAKTVYFQVTWQDEAGNILAQDTVEAGAVPAYYGETPVKPEDDAYTYEFAGWTPEVTAISDNTTYTAVFSAVEKPTEPPTEAPTEPVTEPPTEPVTEEPPTEPVTEPVTEEVPTEEIPTEVPTEEVPTEEVPTEEVPTEEVPTEEVPTDEDEDAHIFEVYHITWRNYDETILAEADLEADAMPVYPPDLPTPEKPADEEFSYTFKGWDPEPAAATQDAVYTAVYEAVPLETTVTITWIDYDGTALAVTEVPVGETPAYPEDQPQPQRPEDESYTYTFAGWDPEPAAATEDTSYMATYTQEAKTAFTIRFVNWDGTLLQSSTAAVGEMPAYTGEDPVKAEDASYTYAFSGWTPEIVPAEKDAEYTAVFTATQKEITYEISWKNWDGTWLQTDHLPAGEMPAYTGPQPQRTADEQNTYEFAGWTPEIVPAAADAVYTAAFTPTPRPVQEEYRVTWQNYDSSVLQSDIVKAGDTASYTGDTPKKPDDDRYTYVFAGWNPQPGKVYSDTVYTATYHSVKKPVDDSYVVVWQNYDYTVLEVDVVKAGRNPVYYGPIPYKPSDYYYRYIFAYWSMRTVPGTSNRVYTAVFYPVLKERTYTIIWQNWDNSVIYSTEVREGMYPQYYGYTPYRPADGQFSYVFTGWKQPIVRAYSNMVYTAEFRAVPIVTQYTITWRNYDGTVLGTDTVNNGEIPAYRGVEPKKAPDGRYTYRFSGWDQPVIAAQSDAVYTAQFRQVPALNRQEVRLFTGAQDEPQEGYPLLFEAGDDQIPYIELSKGFDQMKLLLQAESGDQDISFDPVYQQDGDSLVFTATGLDGSQVIIDLDQNTVRFTDYTGFSSYSPALFSKSGLLREAQVSASTPATPSELQISLDDYDISVYAVDGMGYMPLATFSDLFLTPAGYNWLYNGSDLFLVTDLDDPATNEQGQTIADLFAGEGQEPPAQNRDEKLAGFTYRELCLLLDVNFGMEEDLNTVKGFDTFFRETGLYPNLSSTNIAAYELGLKKLSEDYFVNAPAVMRQNGYEEVDNTAYITIGSFCSAGIDLTSPEVQASLEQYLATDVAALIAYANRQIRREGSPITNVVIDVAACGGADLHAALYTMAWVLGKADIYTKDVLTGDHEIRSYEADVDLDGQITEADRLDLTRFNVFCLTTSATRDYGNLMAGVFKASDAVTIVGQTTGGGAHDIRNVITASGRPLAFPGCNEYCTFKAGAYTSIAAGIDADVYLKDISVFSNRYKLGAILDDIR